LSTYDWTIAEKTKITTGLAAKDAEKSKASSKTKAQYGLL